MPPIETLKAIFCVNFPLVKRKKDMDKEFSKPWFTKGLKKSSIQKKKAIQKIFI